MFKPEVKPSAFKAGDIVKIIEPEASSRFSYSWKANSEINALKGTVHKIISNDNRPDWFRLDPGTPNYVFHQTWLELVIADVDDCQCPNLLHGHLKKCRYLKK